MFWLSFVYLAKLLEAESEIYHKSAQMWMENEGVQPTAHKSKQYADYDIMHPEYSESMYTERRRRKFGLTHVTRGKPQITLRPRT